MSSWGNGDILVQGLLGCLELRMIAGEIGAADVASGTPCQRANERALLISGGKADQAADESSYRGRRDTGLGIVVVGFSLLAKGRLLGRHIVA